MVTEHFGYRLHEALPPVPCATIAFARSKSFASTRIARSPADGLVSGTAAVAISPAP